MTNPPPTPSRTATPLARLPRAIAFDVFGTVVDWHGGVAAEAAALAARHGIAGDWSSFANAWRSGYAPAMDAVRRGERGWAHIDTLHREILDRIAPAHGLAALGDAHRVELNRAWHRLPPWPDAVAGLARLKRAYTITPLSNGNFSLLTNLAKHGGLPWDCIVSAELFNHYKPDPEVYLGCARLLDVAPHELMLVACHPSDLRAAAACGLMTAYVPRPLEHGAATVLPTVAEGDFDCVAKDFEQLADRLMAAGLDPAASMHVAGLARTFP
jgi:2-haloacid dehalogenase